MMPALMLASCSTYIPTEELINDPLIKNGNSSNEFSLITFNMQAILGKSEEKTEGLANYLNDNKYDFVVLQEVFDEDARENLISRIDTSHYISMIERVDYETFPEILFQDAGLLLLSSRPAIDLSLIDFGNNISKTGKAISFMLEKELSFTTDILANKSILGSLHSINDSNAIFVFTTHKQAIGTVNHRHAQLRQIKKFIDIAVWHVLKAGIVQPRNLTVILAGDFNIDAHNFDDYADMLYYLGNPRDLLSEFKPGNEEYTISFRLMNFYKRFDYIFAYDKLGPMPLRKVKIKNINATDIIGTDLESISDHRAIKSLLTY